jgi:hypothetical protein
MAESDRAPARRPAATAAEGRFDFLWLLAAPALVLALGAARLTAPLGPEQELALTAARALEEGARLYVDVVVDLPPAVIWFHHAAGVLFGFTADGVRLFELCLMLVFSAVMVSALGDYVRHRWLAAVAPIAVIGSACAWLPDEALTAAETLVGLPLFLAAWLLSRRYPTPETTALGHVGAGAAVAVASLFTMTSVAVALACVAVVAADVRRHHRLSPVMSFLFVARRVVYGFIVVWFLVMMAFHGDDALRPMLSTVAATAFNTVDGARPGSALFGLAPWALLAVPALRRGAQPDEPMLTAQMTAWLAMAAVLTAIAAVAGSGAAPLLWLWPPVGVLAVRGVDLILDGAAAAGRLPSWPASALALLLVAPAAAVSVVPAAVAAAPMIAALIDGRSDLGAP